MGYEYSFMDNQKYGADEINNIIKALATKGIAIEYENIFKNEDAYTPDKLNEIMMLLATKGVIKQMCQVVHVPNKAGSIMVTQGIIILSNGSTITVDEYGEELSYQSGVKQYVYATNSFSFNKNSLICSTTPPDEKDVPLAEIEISGAITDKRVFSRGKLLGFTSIVDTPRLGVNVAINDCVFNHASTPVKWTSSSMSIDSGTKIQYNIMKNNYLYQLFAAKASASYDGYTYIRKIDSNGVFLFKDIQINHNLNNYSPSCFYVADNGKCYIGFNRTYKLTDGHMYIIRVSESGILEKSIDLDFNAADYQSDDNTISTIAVDGFGNIYVYFEAAYYNAYSVLIHSSDGSLKYTHTETFNNYPKQFVGHPTEGYVYGISGNILRIWCPNGLYDTKTLESGKYVSENLQWKNGYLYSGPHRYTKLGAYVGIDLNVYLNTFPDIHGNYVVGGVVYNKDKQKVMENLSVKDYYYYFDNSIEGIWVTVNRPNGSNIYQTNLYETYPKIKEI